MKIDRQFNTFTKQEYFFSIDNYEKYSNFNTLGLYRSILENENLLLEEKIEIRDYANQTFQKTFDFLQIKDPSTYVKLVSLGVDLTKADERQIWKDVVRWQEKTLADKKIKHRNFGDYSKHNCGDTICVYNGLMVHQSNSRLKEMVMHFDSDNRSHNFSAREIKPERHKKESRDFRDNRDKIEDDE